MHENQKNEIGGNVNFSTNRIEAARLVNTVEISDTRNSLYQGYIFPSLLTRFKALLIDTIIILAVFVICSYLFELFRDISGFVRAFVLVFMFYIYDPFMVSQFGGTLGHRLLGIQVKDFDHPLKNIGILKALLRFFIKGILGWASFISVTISKNKRAIHDHLSGSVVLFSSGLQQE